MQLTRRLSNGCEDKNCPHIYETDQPGMLGVTITRLSLADRWRSRKARSRGEVTGLIPEARFHEAAVARGYRRP